MKLFLASASPRRRAILAMMPFPFEVYVPSFDERAYEDALLAAPRDVYAAEPAPLYPTALSPVDATPIALSPAEITREIARGKALCAYRELKRMHPDEPILILSADTIVVLDSEIFGKGEQREKALSMLRRLNGRKHEVISAVWLVGDAAPLPADAAPTGTPAVAAQTCSPADPSLSPADAAPSPAVSESILETSAVYFGQSDEELLEHYVDTERPYDKAGAYGIQDGGALLVDRIEGSFHNIMGLPVRSVYQLLRRHLRP